MIELDIIVRIALLALLSTMGFLSVSGLAISIPWTKEDGVFWVMVYSFIIAIVAAGIFVVVVA